VKTWLFTTLYREFLDHRQQEARWVTEADGSAVRREERSTTVDMAVSMDAAAAREALLQLEEPFRTTLTLFYLQEHTYQEIADILGVPIGTVMSRISRGRNLLRERLSRGAPPPVRAN
jgi:RNA polymerase sigma-70 factor (ECF subfamily)